MGDSVTSTAPAAPPAGWADRVEATAIFTFADHAAAIAAVDLLKLRRDPTELLTRAVQPLLWFLVFGQVFARTRAIPTGSLSYLEFMAPGILAQSVLFAAIFYGIAVIWERDLGIVHKMLVSPASRSSLVVGKALAAGVRGLVQGVLVVVIALVMGVRVRVDPAGRARRVGGGVSRLGALRDVFARGGLRGENPGTLHGHRAGADDADVFRQQRDLSDQHDAALARARSHERIR